MDCHEYREIVSAHVDGALAASEASEAKAHLHQCPRCEKMFAWEIKATKLLKGSLSRLSPKYELKEKILEQLNPVESRWPQWLVLNHAWAPALLVLLIMSWVYWGWPFGSQQDLFAHTAGYYQRVNQDRSHLSPATDTYLTARILDLTPWGYELFGKEIQRVNGQENRVFAYYGVQKELLVAHELEAHQLSLPRGSTIVKKFGKDFVIGNSGKVNLVAWQDKNMVCIIASQLPQDRLLGLAAEIVRQS